MSDLIRRKVLCDYISAAYYDDRFNDPEVLLDELFERAKHFPAVDAVEVVRCSQCKYWEPMNNGSWMNRNRTDGCCRVLMKCRLAERYNTEKDHFCCYGKRREDNAVD